MSAFGRTVPVYPTLAGLVSRPLRTPAAHFPFTVPGGSWTFSGRVALFHGLPALGLPRGSTILVPNYHQGVEIDTLLAAGHRLRYYRVNERLEMDFGDVARGVDDTVSALYVIHYFGFPQPAPAAREFCRAHGLKLIEDCALSLFSRHEGRWLGSDGDLAIFSVYKTLALPHGGFLVTRNAAPRPTLRPAPLKSTVVQTIDLVRQTLGAAGWGALNEWSGRASRAVSRLLRWNRSRTVSSGGSDWDGRLLHYGASRWVVELTRHMDADAVIQRRRANYAQLAARLVGRLPCPFPELPPETCPLFFPVFVRDKVAFHEALAGLGVQSVNLWDASHPTCPANLAAEVEHWRRHCLELPIHQALDERAVNRVAAAALAVEERQRAARTVERACRI